MSETQRNPFTKRACDLLIAGAFILLAIFWVSLDIPNPAVETETVKATPSPRHHRCQFRDFGQRFSMEDINMLTEERFEGNLKGSAAYRVRLGMQIANVKQRQILPRVGNQIWVSTPRCTSHLGEYAAKIETTGPGVEKNPKVLLK